MSSMKVLIPEEYSFDRKKAELEKRGIKVSDDKVEEEFSKSYNKPIVKNNEVKKMSEENSKGRKSKGLVVAVQEEIKNGNTNVEDIAKKTGASVGTVKVQIYKMVKNKK